MVLVSITPSHVEKKILSIMYPLEGRFFIFKRQCTHGLLLPRVVLLARITRISIFLSFLCLGRGGSLFMAFSSACVVLLSFGSGDSF